MSSCVLDTARYACASLTQNHVPMREALHVRVQVAMIGRWGGGAKECGGRWQQMKAMSRGRRRVPSQSQHSLRQNTSICINIAIVSRRALAGSTQNARDPLLPPPADHRRSQSVPAR